MIDTNLKENLRAKYIERNGKAKQYYYSEMIQASEKVRIDINKSSDPFEMLDLSLLCIYFLTGDKMFYEQNRDKLINMIAAMMVRNLTAENLGVKNTVNINHRVIGQNAKFRFGKCSKFGNVML